MTCRSHTYLVAFSWLLGERNLKRRENQGVHSPWCLQPMGHPASSGPGLLSLAPLTLWTRSFFPVGGHPVHCRMCSNIPGFCPPDARSVLPFVVTTKDIPKCPRGRVARGKITSGWEPLCQTSSANPNTKNFPFTDLTSLRWSSWTLRWTHNRANWHKDMEGAEAHGAKSGVPAARGN